MHLNSSNDLNNNQRLNYINVTLWFYTKIEKQTDLYK